MISPIMVPYNGSMAWLIDMKCSSYKTVNRVIVSAISYLILFQMLKGGLQITK